MVFKVLAILIVLSSFSAACDDCCSLQNDIGSCGENRIEEVLLLSRLEYFMKEKEENRDVACKPRAAKAVENPGTVTEETKGTPAAAGGSKEVEVNPAPAPEEGTEAGSSAEDNTVEMAPAAAEEGSKTTEGSRLLAETEGSLVAAKVVLGRQNPVWVMSVILLIVVFFAGGEEPSAKELQKLASGIEKEIDVLLQEISSEEEVTIEKVTDMLSRMDRLCSENELPLKQLESVVVDERPIKNKHDLLVNEIGTSFTELLQEIASWRVVLMRGVYIHEDIEMVTGLWDWYWPRKGEEDNATIELVLDDVVSSGDFVMLESTLEGKGYKEKGMKTNWEPRPIQWREDHMIQKEP